MQAFVIPEAVWLVMDGRSTSRAERTEEMTGSVLVTVVGFGFRVYGLGFRLRETRKIPEISIYAVVSLGLPKGPMFDKLLHHRLVYPMQLPSNLEFLGFRVNAVSGCLLG